MSNKQLAAVTQAPAKLPEIRSVIAAMAQRFGMEKQAFEATIKATIMPANSNVSNEQLVAFLIVAKEYDLSPFTKEIYAFPSRGGGIQPIVSIDGWLKIINSHKQFDGMEFVDERNTSGDLLAVTCRIHRKDREHPVEVTEYMEECRRDTDTWKKYPVRMLRHKATIQCARYAFGFSGIVDPDEAERIQEAQAIDVMPGKPVVVMPKAKSAQPLIEAQAEPEGVPDPDFVAALNGEVVREPGED